METVSLSDTAKRSVIEYTTQFTGIRVHVTPVPMRMWLTVQSKLEQEYPDPKPPMKQVDDNGMQFAMGETEYEDFADEDYQKALLKAQNDRAKHQKRTLYSRFVSFPDFESHQDFIDLFEDDIAFAKANGVNLPDDDYEIAIFYCALHTPDEKMIQKYMMNLIPVTQEETVEQLTVFRPKIQRRASQSDTKE